jgi:hypothetical protein
MRHHIYDRAKRFSPGRRRGAPAPHPIIEIRTSTVGNFLDSPDMENHLLG